MGKSGGGDPVARKKARELIGLFRAAGGYATLPALFAPRPVPVWAARATQTLVEDGVLTWERAVGGWVYRLSDAEGGA